MENSAQESDTKNNTHLINSFTEITSATKEEAVFFLESHQWDLDAAVSTFLDNPFEQQQQQPVNVPPATNNSSPSHSDSQLSPQSPPWVPMRSRSPSPSPTSRPQYELRSRRGSGGESRKPKTRAGGIRTLADLNSAPLDESGSDDDEPQEYYTGGEKSGMLVQDPTRGNSVDAIFDQARQSAVDRSDLQRPSSSRAFSGTARLLSGETVASAPSHPEVVSHNITFWSNGFTIDDGPLRRFDDPANASFMESIRRSECPRELEPADKRTRVQVELNRREEDYSEPPRRRSAFQGVGRTLGSNTTTTTTTDPPASDASAAADSFKSAPPPSTGLVVDKSLPTTSIQLRLADGTRMVSRFNFHHTIRDVHAFIDASRPGGTRNYQLQAMGFPPKQLTDLDQTIEQAGIANSVVIQKF